jgi:hypothetical protein
MVTNIITFLAFFIRLQHLLTFIRLEVPDKFKAMLTQVQRGESAPRFQQQHSPSHQQQ